MELTVLRAQRPLAGLPGQWQPSRLPSFDLECLCYGQKQHKRQREVGILLEGTGGSCSQQGCLTTGADFQGLE